MRVVFSSKWAWIAGALLLFVGGAQARVPRRYAVFGGYSWRADIVPRTLNFAPISIPTVGTLAGWNGSFEANFFHVVGAVADVSGYYGSYGATLGCEAILGCVPVSGNVNSRLYTVLVGPQISVSLWRFTPFVHALFGVAHLSQNPELAALGGLSSSESSFADAIGGGLDFRIVRRASIRLQGDLLQTRFFNVPPPLGLFLPSQNGFRGSVGVVYRF